MPLQAFNPNSAATATTPTGWTIGNKQNLSGSFSTDTDFVTSIKFLGGPGGNQISGIDSGSYSPLADGSEPGTALADIAARLRVGVQSPTTVGGWNMDLALRNVLYSLESGVLPVTLGSFDSNLVSSGLLSEDIAYRGRNGFGVFGGILTGLVGSGTETSAAGDSAASVGASAGSVVVVTTPEGSVATLTVPFNVPITLDVQAGGFSLPIIHMNLTGTIVGAAMVPEPATVGMLAVGMAMLVPIAVRRWRRS